MKKYIPILPMLLAANALKADALENIMGAMFEFMFYSLVAAGTGIVAGIVYARKRRPWQRIALFVIAGALVVFAAFGPFGEGSGLEALAYLLVFVALGLALLGLLLQPIASSSVAEVEPISTETLKATHSHSTNNPGLATESDSKEN